MSEGGGDCRQHENGCFSTHLRWHSTKEFYEKSDSWRSDSRQVVYVPVFSEAAPRSSSNTSMRSRRKEPIATSADESCPSTNDSSSNCSPTNKTSEIHDFNERESVRSEGGLSPKPIRLVQLGVTTEQPPSPTTPLRVHFQCESNSATAAIVTR